MRKKPKFFKRVGKWHKRIKTNDRYQERNFDNRGTNLLKVVVKVSKNLGKLVKVGFGCCKCGLGCLFSKGTSLSPQKNK